MKRIDVALAVILRQGKILICRRKAEDSFGGYWEFPGGKCEAGESLQDCLHREVREELDITVDIAGPLTPICHDYPRVLLTLHPFLCRHRDGEPKLLECQEAIWVDPAALRDYQFPPANDAMLAEIVARVSASPANPDDASCSS